MPTHTQNLNLSFLHSIVVYCLCTSSAATFLLSFPSVKVVCICSREILLVLQTLKLKELYKKKAYFTVVLKWGVHVSFEAGRQGKTKVRPLHFDS